MKNLLFLALLLVTMSACQKVIEIDLNKTDPKITIEGQVTDQIGDIQVKISKSVNFSDTNIFPPVTGAVVTITDNSGIIQTLTETKSGIYTLKNTQGVSGKTYSLKVVAEGKTYTASSTMPKAVDFLGAEIMENSFGNAPNSLGKVYNIFPLFLDPAEIKNNYLFFLYNKEKKGKTFENVLNDNLFNGNRFPAPLRSTGALQLMPKDTLTVEMLCIDTPVYDYFYGLSEISSNNGNSATPTNPINNISGGALGYFSAHTVRKVSVIVP
jgi:Domain of unknown function (DUF4249)